MGELLELPLLLSQLLLEVGMLPTLLVLSMLPSVRLRLSQRLRLMLVFSMELTAMVLVLVMLALDMDIPVLDMLDMEDMVLAMAVSAMLVLATMARDLLMLSPRLMLVRIMEDMGMVLVLDMLDSDMLDMADTDLDTEDTVLDMAVVSTMVKQLFIQQKLKSNLFVIQCPLDG